jgi:hypothetical protein
MINYPYLLVTDTEITKHTEMEFTLTVTSTYNNESLTDKFNLTFTTTDDTAIYDISNAWTLPTHFLSYYPDDVSVMLDVYKDGPALEYSSDWAHGTAELETLR